METMVPDSRAFQQSLKTVSNCRSIKRIAEARDEYQIIDRDRGPLAPEDWRPLSRARKQSLVSLSRLVFREGAQGELGHGNGSAALFGFGLDKMEAGRHPFFRGSIFFEALKR